MNDIAECLGDPPSARKLLQMMFEQVKQSSNTCYEKSKSIDAKFTDWLLYVCELYAACVQLENNDGDVRLSHQISLVAEQSRIDYQRSTVDEAKKISDLLAKQIDFASNSLKKASEEFPAK